jgi:hypothetical protein
MGLEPATSGVTGHTMMLHRVTPSGTKLQRVNAPTAGAVFAELQDVAPSYRERHAVASPICGTSCDTTHEEEVASLKPEAVKATCRLGLSSNHLSRRSIER